MAHQRSRPIKVAYIQHNPTSYRTPMEVQLVHREDLEMKVFYCSETEVDKAWEIALEDGAFQILPAWHPRFGEEFHLHWNPGILRVLRDGDFDVIVTGGYIHLTMLTALLWARWHRVPYIVLSESNLRKPRGVVKKTLKWFLLRPLLRSASAGLAIGSYAKAYLNYYGVPEARIFIFPNTPDVDRFSAESARYRKRESEVKCELNLSEDRLICFVGKFVQLKRVDLLLSAFCQLQTDPEVRINIGLVLVGDGPERKQLEERVREEAIRNVHFLGFQQPRDLPRIYAISDLFVLPSQHETWGVVVNEAMACGLPVVVTERVGAAGDIVRDGENGYIVPVDDLSALHQAMKRIIGDSELRERMGQKSSRIIRSWNYEMGIRNFIAGLRAALEVTER